jgi:hypothetical protein
MTASGVLLGLRPSRLTPYCFVTKPILPRLITLTGLGGAAVVNTSSKCKRYRSSNFMKREMIVAAINRPADQLRFPRQMLELGKAAGAFAGGEGVILRVLFSGKYLQAKLILPVLGLLLFGCSSIQGTGGNQKLNTGRVAAYTVEPQQQAQPADPDPTYEWFY